MYSSRARKQNKLIIKKEIKLKRGMDGESILRFFVDKGYLLHGSSSDLKIIKPRDALDFNQDGLFTNLRGVYATSVPATALFFAITPKAIKEVDGDFGKGTGRFFLEKRSLAKMTKGFVYVLSAKDFYVFGDERVSLKAVIPLLKISVQPSNFKYKIEDIKSSDRHDLYPRPAFDLNRAIAVIERNANHKLNSHGRWHIVRSVIYAKIIATKLCPQYLNEILLGVILHDVGRKSDKPDYLHAKRSVGIAKRLIKRHWPGIPTDRVLYAIEHHNRNRISNDPVIGIIWDADRLDLVRFGYSIDKRLLSTVVARQLIPFAKFISSKYKE